MYSEFSGYYSTVRGSHFPRYKTWKNAMQKCHFEKGKKNYIDDELNPSKKILLDNTNEDYVELKLIDEILPFLWILKQGYDEALPISDDNDFQIHYKRLPNSCFWIIIFVMDLCKMWAYNQCFVHICPNLKVSVR